MSWENKLEILKNAAKSRNPYLSIGLELYEPVNSDDLAKIKKLLPFELPTTLNSLYLITDGLRIPSSFTIFGLQSNYRYGIKNDLATKNNRYLAGVQRFFPVKFLFGYLTGGDFLCLTNEGAVVIAAAVDCMEVETIAKSLDEFFDYVCLGKDYIQFRKPNEFWVQVLKDFNFI